MPEVLFSEIEKVKYTPTLSPHPRVRVDFSHYTIFQFLFSAFTQEMVWMVASGTRHTGEVRLWYENRTVFGMLSVNSEIIPFLV